MRYRCFKQTSTGKWIDVLLTRSGDTFSVSMESHRKDIALAFGVDPTSLEVVDSDTDLRSGELLPVPQKSPSPPSRKEELLAIGRDNWTDAQQKELIELLAGVV
jgi:hypothetical protein